LEVDRGSPPFLENLRSACITPEDSPSAPTKRAACAPQLVFLGKEENILPLPGFEPRNLGRSLLSFVTIPTTLLTNNRRRL